MATKSQKVIILNEGVDIDVFVEENIKVASENIVDAVDAMALDDDIYDPEINPDLVQCNKELGIITMALSPSEAKKMDSKDFMDVLSVEDDFEVFADNFNEDDDKAINFNDDVDVDPEIEKILDEDEILRTHCQGLKEDELEDYITELDLTLASTIEHSTIDEPFDAELSDLEYGFEQDSEAQKLFDNVDINGMSRGQIFKIITCIVQCLIKNLGKASSNVSEAELGSMLESSGLPNTSEVRTLARDLITRGLYLIYAPQAWRYSTGAGVRVAVVDTGITPRHPDLRVYGGVSYVPGVRSWADDNGHGTHVAGTIGALANKRGVIGVAPNARLYSVKVLNKDGSGSLSSVLNGLAWCYRARMHIVNLSLGSRASNHSVSNYSAAYERMGRILRSRGILAVAAAGNNRGPVGNPARCPSYLAVSAIDMRRRRAGFSCFGPQVELSAPGVGVLSTWPSSTYRSLNGTSMATPHVAGVAALVKSRRPSWHGDRIRVHLWRTALDLGTPGRDWLFGYGQVNAYRAVTQA